jgi:phage gpG-like protein
MSIARWNGDGIIAEAHQAMERRLDAAAIHLQNAVKRKLSVPGTGRVRGRKSGPVTHAPEGQPPYKQTGRLRASIAWERSAALTRRVGSNVEYARNQELGLTVRPHPYLRPSLAEESDTLRRILQR